MEVLRLREQEVLLRSSLAVCLCMEPKQVRRGDVAGEAGGGGVRGDPTAHQQRPRRSHASQAATEPQKKTYPTLTPLPYPR